MALMFPRIGAAYAPQTQRKKAFICRHDICTPSRNTMPEQFPLYLNPSNEYPFLNNLMSNNG